MEFKVDVYQKIQQTCISWGVEGILLPGRKSHLGYGILDLGIGMEIGYVGEVSCF